MYYIRQPPPKSLIPAKVAILGPPKSGKTTGLFSFSTYIIIVFIFNIVAKRIIQELGCIRLSLVSLNSLIR